MSSEDSLLATLTLVQTNLYKFIGPILIGVGTVSCILSLMVFTRKNRRKNPCAIYLTARNICNFLLIYTSLLYSTLATGYEIDPSAYNLGFCRFRFYTMFLFDILSPCYLILASIDQILLTSRNARTRQRSTPRLAYICVIAITLFWLLAHIHSLFLSNLTQFAPGIFACYFQSSIYLILMGYYSLIIKGILIPLLMIISGLWAIKNIRSMGPVAPAPLVTVIGTTAVRSVRASLSRDRQLRQLLLIDIGVYIIFNIMAPVVLMYQQITENASATLTKTQINVLLLSIAVFSTYVPFCIGCYTNLFVSKVFRHEIKNILMCN